MKYLLMSLALFLVVGCSHISNTDRQTTVQVLSEDGNASAVMVAPNRALTAAHVTRMEKLTIDGKPAKVLKVDELADVALLEVDRDCPCATVASIPVAVDGAISMIGYPIASVIDNKQVRVLGHFLFDLSYANANVKRTFSIYWGFSAPGSSGGGVYNADGELVGIISGIPSLPGTGGMFGQPQLIFNIVAAAPLEAIKAILKE